MAVGGGRGRSFLRAVYRRGRYSIARARQVRHRRGGVAVAPSATRMPAIAFYEGRAGVRRPAHYANIWIQKPRELGGADAHPPAQMFRDGGKVASF